MDISTLPTRPPIVVGLRRRASRSRRGRSSCRRALPGIVALSVVTASACGGDSGPTGTTTALDPPFAGPAPVPSDAGRYPYERLGGTRIVFRRSAGGSRSWVIIDGPTRSAWAIEAGASSTPAIAPNGLLIAHTAYTDAKTVFDVYVTPVGGGEGRQLSRVPNQDQAPSWTPDGADIVFYHPPSTFVTFFRQSVDGQPGFESIILRLSGILEETWDPTGRVAISSAGELLFATLGPRNGIYRVPAGGDEPELLIAPSPSAGSEHVTLWAPSWSPDESQIGYLELRSPDPGGPGMHQISVNAVAASGGTPTIVASFTSPGRTSAGGHWSLCWTADGSALVLDVPEGEHTARLWLAEAEGGEPIPLTGASGAADLEVSCSR